LTKRDNNIPDLQALIRESATAYELAIAAHLGAERAARQHRSLKVKAIEAGRDAVNNWLEQEDDDRRTPVDMEAARVEMLMAAAEEVKRCAIVLRDRVALARERERGSAHVTAEVRLARFEEVQVPLVAMYLATAELRAALLRLAWAYADSEAWEPARRVLIHLRAEVSGVLQEEVEELLRLVYIKSASRERDKGDWEQARMLTEEAIAVVPADKTYIEMLRRIVLHEAQQLLPWDPSVARENVVACIETYGDDPRLSQFVLDATMRLADDALADGYFAYASEWLSSAVTYQDGRSRVHEWIRRHPAVGWLRGDATLLYEFGGHSKRIVDMTFTADGRQMISVDGTDAKTWTVVGTNAGSLSDTIPLPDTYAVSPAGLAVTQSGELRTASTAEFVAFISAHQGRRMAAHAFSRDGGLMAYSVREQSSFLETNRRGQPSEQDKVSAVLGSVHPETDSWSYQEALEAVEVGRARGNYPYMYPLKIRRMETVTITDVDSNAIPYYISLPEPTIRLSLAVSGDHRLIASFSSEGRVTVTDIESRATRFTFRTGLANTMHNPLIFSPGDDYLLLVVSSQWKSMAFIWELKSGREMVRQEIPGTIGSIDISPDQEIVALLGTEGTVRVFPLREPTAVSTVGTHGSVQHPRVKFSPDGTQLATCDDYAVRVWTLP
jgi:WD40 repeat protein